MLCIVDVERNLISLRIYLTKTDSATGESVTEGHAVTGISYIKTTSKNYVGIYNGWGLDENNNQIDESGLIYISNAWRSKYK